MSTKLKNNQFNDLMNNEIDPNREYFINKHTSSTKFTILMKYALTRDWTAIKDHFNALKKCGESQLIKYIINQQNDKGWTPLMMVCSGQLLYNNVMIVQMLLNNGADVDLKNSDGNTALMVLVSDEEAVFPHSNNNLEIVEMLLKRGADVNTQNQYGYTALMISGIFYSMNYSVRLIELLLKYNANVNIRDIDGDSALMWICEQFNSEKFDVRCVKLLLDEKADVNLQNKYKETALMIAARQSTRDNSIEIIQLLLDGGANVNVMDEDNRVAFRFAYDVHAEKQGNIETLKLLLRYKTDVNLVIGKVISLEDIIQMLL